MGSALSRCPFNLSSILSSPSWPGLLLSPSHQGPEAVDLSEPRSAQHPVPSAGPPRTEAAASAWPGAAPGPASAQRPCPCSGKRFRRQRMGTGARAHKEAGNFLLSQLPTQCLMLLPRTVF